MAKPLGREGICCLSARPLESSCFGIPSRRASDEHLCLGPCAWSGHGSVVIKEGLFLQLLP